MSDGDDLLLVKLSLNPSNSKCRKSGHRLFTSYGHCIQCDTSKIAYRLRKGLKGYVYLASSEGGTLSKIGMTEGADGESEIRQRQAALRNGYANQRDWTIFAYFKTDEAGKHEMQLSRELRNRASNKGISYKKDGREQLAQEAFYVDSIEAMDIFINYARVNSLAVIECSKALPPRARLPLTQQKAKIQKANPLVDLNKKAASFFERLLGFIKSTIRECSSNTKDKHSDEADFLGKFKIKDKRHKGGALWIDEAIKDVEDVKRLEALGFIFSEKRKAWYKK
jgi:hypothetical protein